MEQCREECGVNVVRSGGCLASMSFFFIFFQCREECGVNVEIVRFIFFFHSS